MDIRENVKKALRDIQHSGPLESAGIAKKIAEDMTGTCWICGKLLCLDDEWEYFAGTLVCKDHPGVKKWYAGALEMSQEKFRLFVKENHEREANLDV